MAIRKRLLALILILLLFVFVVHFSFITSSSSYPEEVHQPPSGPTKTPTRTTTKTKTTTKARTETTATKKLEKQDGRPKFSSGPTEPPYIGDFYASEDLPEPSVCPESLRHRLKETEFFNVFLNQVPILQQRKHATEEEFHRLGHYSGANGYGNVDYHTLVSSLSVLNSSANWMMLDDWPSRSIQSESQTSGAQQSQCSRCAVVGNGGILKNSKKGKEIDAHHYVFRTNGAVIRGFEEDVGTRTTHYVFSTNTLFNSLRSYASRGYTGPPKASETRYVFIPDHDRDYLMVKAAADHAAIQTGPDKGKSPMSLFGGDITSKKLKIFHPDFIRYLRNRFLRSKILQTQYKDIYRPSTGATMLLAALHSCDEVSAYGFLTWDYSRYSEHYYDLQYRPLAFYANHDLRLEASLWQRLHHANLVHLYMGEGH